MFFDDLKLNVLATLLTYVSHFIVGIFLFNFLKNRYQNKLKNWIIYFIIVTIFYIIYKSNTFLFSIRAIFVILSYLISTIILSNDKWYKKLLFVALFFIGSIITTEIDYYSLSLKLDVPTSELDSIINGTTEQYMELFDKIVNSYYSLVSVAYNNILITFYFLIVLLFKNRKEYKGFDIFLIMFFITLFGYVTCQFSSFYIKNDAVGLIITIMTSIATISMLIYTYKKLEFYKVYNEKVAEVKYLKEKEQLKLNYYKDMLYKETELMKVHHDIKNNIQVMTSLKNKEEKDKILNKISERLTENEIIKYSKIEILNIILNLKKREATSKNIDITIEIRKSIDFMEEIDISNLFSNILDNAINNIDPNNKKIELTVYQKMNYIVVKCINTFDETKKDINKGKNHGYGLKIISDIAKKYNGEVKIKKENNEFELIILLAKE